MKPLVSTPTEPKLEAHRARVAALDQEVRRLEEKANRISWLRLSSFLAAALAAFSGFQGIGALAWLLAAALAATFFAAVVWHAKVLAARRKVIARRAVHERHTQRLSGTWHTLPSDGASLLEPGHDYARDIDLVGKASLFQRIDVSHTLEGATALAQALAHHADRATIRARQAAVAELAGLASLREELETRASEQRDKPDKLDHGPFVALVSRPRLTTQKHWIGAVAVLSPILALAAYVLGAQGLVPELTMWLVLLAQGALLWALREPVHHTLDVVTARLGFAEAYEGMLQLIEETDFESAHLRALKERLVIAGKPPSMQMARLRRYEGFAQLRTQGPVYLVLNVLTLWDLHCLVRIERWLAEVGPSTEAWFSAIGELEMLCSLATLLDGDPSATLPTIDDDDDGPLRCEGLAHPLLSPASRVPNDVALDGTGSAAIVTGSNMAGKSTLLRAVGLNTALALAGGPVTARAMHLPVVRMRASMRVEDSLQRGASYFHAELEKLKSIIATLDRPPRVLFLLDELLRGTNARARSQGARAVVEHLLARGALGLVATHDVALSDLADKYPGRVFNCHFTDVFTDGEMRFDYVLRPGPVKTSNALRLLAMAGVDVPQDDRVA